MYFFRERSLKGISGGHNHQKYLYEQFNLKTKVSKEIIIIKKRYYILCVEKK